MGESEEPPLGNLVWLKTTDTTETKCRQCVWMEYPNLPLLKGLLTKTWYYCEEGNGSLEQPSAELNSNKGITWRTLNKDDIILQSSLDWSAAAIWGVMSPLTVPLRHPEPSPGWAALLPPSSGLAAWRRSAGTPLWDAGTPLVVLPHRGARQQRVRSSRGAHKAGTTCLLQEGHAPRNTPPPL